ncbi:MAG: PIN domain-containing protein [Candidatus Kuenenia sp.]|nr:PIN domain-containing protein [Candidatus Kuenenia hertensis]
MKLYLDLCVYNRPFDDQGHDRIALETSIFTYILEKIETDVYVLVTSDALTYENNKNPDSLKSARISTYFELAHEFVEINNSDYNRAKELKGFGFSDIDALHISLAERSQADYFITCDDDIVNRFKKHKDFIKIKIVSLAEFIGMEVK